MQVLNYEAHNVLRLSDVNLNMEGRHLFLVGGKNGQGKSSTLKALAMALCGKSGMPDYPDVPLKAGETKGWVKVSLSGEAEMHDTQGFKVELHWRRKRDGSVEDELRVLDSTGDEAPSPRKTLQDLYSLAGFDPLAFEKLDRKKQRELLEKLLGLDFTAQKKEYQKLYEERAALNKQGIKVKAQADAMPYVPGLPAQEQSISDLLAEVERRKAANTANAQARQAVKDREDLLLNVNGEIDKINEQIKLLQAKLAGLVAEQTNLTAKLASEQAAVATLVDEDETEARTALRDAEATNQKIRANLSRNTILRQLDGMRQESATLTEAMEKITEQQQDAIAKTKWPVAGMGFDDNGVLLNGLPFEQASKRERIIASFRIGMALNPTLKLFICQDGSDLDADSLADLDKLLEENGYQALVELVTRGQDDEERCAVIIRDGSVEQDAVEDTAP